MYVALRKESVDRNAFPHIKKIGRLLSLSARRAWIEIPLHDKDVNPDGVALRKESVDRNMGYSTLFLLPAKSLSARRAWIEITNVSVCNHVVSRRSPQGERG